jgi:uncharacterized membrane protein (UPF0127 family)
MATLGKQVGNILLPVVAFLLLVSGVYGCNRSVAELPVVSAVFVREDGSESETFSLEVAATEVHRNKGLMFRTKMPERDGMIFLFPSERINSFWMKNTILSLDMLFVASDWKIVGLLPKVPPQNELPRQVDRPSQYVIELGAGVAEKFRINVGDSVKIVDNLPVVVR